MKCGPRVSTSKLRANMSQFNALVSTTTSAVLPVRTNRSCFRAPALGTTSMVVPNRVWAKAVNHDDHPRQSAGFHPDIWGDLFLASSSTASASENEMLEHEKLKQDVRKMIITASEDPARNLGLVDSIQRLGVSYHFEEEIKELLQKMHDNYDRYRKDNADNLSNISLCFRLLRQEGFRISSDMFSRFKDHEGNFNVSQEDIEGLLALHEATQLRVHGENILDEALVFTLAQLTSILVNNSNSLLSKQIKHYLRYPIRKNIPRLEAKFYISIYKEKPSHSQVLLKFSKLDFNILQKQHNEELTQMSRWWKEELGVERNFPFTRDRIVESYFQVVGFYFEPQYGLGRKFVGKAMAIASVLDDINDVYGTPEELDLLDEAIQRWDPEFAAQLPDYMRHFFLALLDIYKEIEVEMAAQGNLYRAHYAIEEAKRLAKAYYTEAKWHHQNYTPSFKEYMQVACESAACSFLIVTFYVGMGDLATKDTFEWASSFPNLVSAVSNLGRLQDDIMTHEFEQKRGHLPSSVELYMKDYGVTKQEAVDEFWRQIDRAWKDINEECLNPTPAPMPLLMPIINLLRVIHVVYNDCDGYTNPHVIKDFVTSTFLDPIPY